ncbi:MAG: hypothetical protein COB41_01660 [Proteobacteria bacterium]|nr:MAG: hypothetical protein COB41_01660 [Pseudomonadota bacterium]
MGKSRLFLVMLFVSTLALSACGGSDGSTPASTSTPAPTVTVTSSSVIEGNAGETSLVFTVDSNITSSQAITINFSTQDGTAQAGSDYIATSGVITFPAGATGGSISVPILGDTAIESDETFTLLLSSPSHASFAGASIIGTIVNDDFPPIALPDTLAPVIVLTGANPLTMSQGTIFTDPGSTVIDNVDIGLIAVVTGTVNTAVAGTYTLNYNVNDAAGNPAATVRRTIKVLPNTGADQTAPTIFLIGANPITVAQGSSFIDAGSMVMDNVNTGLIATVTGSVNTAVVGTYTLTYNVSDAAGNPATTVTRTVHVTDQTAPVIALTGANPVTVAQGSTYVDAGSSVTDNVDTGLTATVTGTVNTAIIGTYTLTYNVSDAAGNAAIAVTRTVNVTDQTAPMITLTGASPIIVAQGSTYVDAGSSVTDNVDVGLISIVTGTVNTSVVGAYTLTYNVSDAAGNAAAAVTRTVNVTDQTAPVIALTGANPVSVAQGSTYVDAGSSVTDNVDTGLIATVTGTVNTAVVGTYTLTYNVSDAAGNPATTVTRTVNVTDQTAPVIALTGANPVTVAQGSTYVDAGSSVTDNVDVGLTATVTGTVNTGTVGTYTLTYNVSDAAGNAATTVTRTVNVVADTIAPVIVLVGANPMTIAKNSTFTDPGSTVTDNVDVGLIATVTGSVNTATVGTYTLTYNVSDAAGNAATTVTRTVSVTDQTPPVITLKGANPLTFRPDSTVLYKDPGSVVTDNVDVVLTATVTGAVLLPKVGTYTLTYNATDAAGNAATPVTRTVNIAYVGPLITLLGENPITIGQHGAYIDPGVIFTGASVPTLTHTSNVDTAVVGAYSVTYNLTDAGGGAPAIPVTRTVNVIAGTTLSMAEATVVEGDIGTSNLVFTVNLSAASAVDIRVDYITSDGTATTANNDYTATAATLTIPAGASSGTITVIVNADTVEEADETVRLTLYNPVNATLTNISAVGFISNDDARLALLNGTGLPFSYPTLSCSPGTDCSYGRDAQATAGTLVKTGGGNAGFDFTKLDINGNPLPVSATAWSCVQDNATGLIWEVKTNTAGLHNTADTYNWYNTDQTTNGGVPGQPDFSGNVCFGYNAADPTTHCNTQAFAARVSATNLCGKSDWRLPKRDELRSIVDYAVFGAAPNRDLTYFPNTSHATPAITPFGVDTNDMRTLPAYWSATPAVNLFSGEFDITVLSFNDGAEGPIRYADPHNIGGSTGTLTPFRARLVSGAPTASGAPISGRLSSCYENMLNEWPDSRYIDHQDGTVTDKKTTLMWKQCAEGQISAGGTCTGIPTLMPFATALTKDGSPFAGYSDWRVPNIKELASLTAPICYKSALNQTMFPNSYSSPTTAGYVYWSSTVQVGGNGAGFPWRAGNVDGAVLGGNGASLPASVRLVRGGL